MFGNRLISIGLTLLVSSTTTAVYAHDPVFGLGPHVLFKGGVEIGAEIDSQQKGSVKEQSLALDLKYGITGDWAVGVNLPYAFKYDSGISSNGKGDIAVQTKYRFWRADSLGLQKSAAVFVKIVSDTADKNQQPALDKGGADTIVGITYGYEARKWYHWASARYRNNSKTKTGFHRGHKQLIDLVAGYRPDQTSYLEPDTVWLLELNGELSDPAEQDGTKLANTGGDEWFLAPGIFWTKRNFAIKAGVQVPLLADLNGSQEKSKYRARLIFEWHI